MNSVVLFLLLLLIYKGTGYPKLCNNEDFDKHRYLYGQETVPCYVFRAGTCLIVSPHKVDASVAQMECTYKYGGQLVVPKNREDVTTIAKKLFFYPNLTSDYQDSKFIIGLIGNKDYGDLRVDVSYYSNTLEPTFWNNVMMSPKDPRIDRSEYPFAEGQEQLLSSEKMNQPAVGACIDKVIGLNPKTAEFEVLRGSDRNYYLCETPRWPKYKCPKGWLLDRSEPMCYKAYSGNWDYVQARLKCRQEKSVIAAARKVPIGEFVFSVFLTYLLNEDTSIPKTFYHTAQRTAENFYGFCDDGSFCEYICNGMSAQATSFEFVSKSGERNNLYQENTHCCHMRECKEIWKIGVICSVRPDQSKAQE